MSSEQLPWLMIHHRWSYRHWHSQLGTQSHGDGPLEERLTCKWCRCWWERFVKLSVMLRNLWQDRGKDWNWFSCLWDPCFIHSVTLLLTVNCALEQIKEKQHLCIYFRKDTQSPEEQIFIPQAFFMFFLVCIRIEPSTFEIFDVREKSFLSQPANEEWAVTQEAGGQDFAVKPRNSIKTSAIAVECCTQDTDGSAEPGILWVYDSVWRSMLVNGCFWSVRAD